MLWIVSVLCIAWGLIAMDSANASYCEVPDVNPGDPEERVK